MSAITPQAPQDTTGLELCCRIAAQHGGLRQAYPRIEALLGAVVCTHAEDRPDCATCNEHFTPSEWSRVAPGPRGGAAVPPGYGAGALAPTGRGALLAGHERDHVSVDHALMAAGVLAGDYDARRAVCSTHGRLLTRSRPLSWTSSGPSARRERHAVRPRSPNGSPRRARASSRLGSDRSARTPRRFGR